MNQQTRRTQQGFTLIELMIVVAIIGILAAIAIPAFMEYMRKGKKGEGDIQINRLAKSAKAYYATNSKYPNDTRSEGSLPSSNSCLQDATTGSGAHAAGLFAPTQFTAVAGLGFVDLEFAPEEAFRFSYLYAGSATGDAFSGTALADLDCDVRTTVPTITAVTPGIPTTPSPGFTLVQVVGGSSGGAPGTNISSITNLD